MWARARATSSAAGRWTRCSPPPVSIRGTPGKKSPCYYWPGGRGSTTYTDPDVRPLWEQPLRSRGIRTLGVLSNTLWPRTDGDERVFPARDGVADRIDAAVYTSEYRVDQAAPAAAFHAVLDALGVDPAPEDAVFVGDRLFEDVWGPAQLGMRTIWLPHSDIPDDQRGHSEGRPDAVIQRLAEIPALLTAWT